MLGEGVSSIFYPGVAVCFCALCPGVEHHKKGYDGKMHCTSMAFEHGVLSMMKKKLSVGRILGV